MKRKSHAGITSVSLPIFVVDTSSATGAGLAGLVFNTASLVAEYRRQGSATWTTITLVTNTLGTYTSGGFIADGALGGAYEVCPPNAALASGVRWVEIRLYGAANMKPVLIEIELDAVDYQDATAFGVANLDTNVGSRPTAAAVAAVILATPAQLLQTDASGFAKISVTQTVPTSNTANTTGDCLNAARAQGFGKWTLDTTAKTLTLYAPDAATVVRTFTVDSVTAPTQRI